MTTLTITPDIAKKKLKLAGTVASGEKVAVTIAGFGTVATENLRLRVMAGDIPVGYFPLENEDAWTVSGADLTCTLNLATWQAERHCKFGAEVCFILEDTGTPQLYGVGDFSLRPWIKLSGVDVPKNLDNYKVRMDALLAEINRVEGVANGKYAKPETGIPKTDLAPSVRTSLDKADAVTLKVSKSAFDALLGLSLPDSATQKDTRQIVQKILTALQNAATCIALMFALPVFGIDGTTAWEDVPPDRTVKSVVEPMVASATNAVLDEAKAYADSMTPESVGAVSVGVNRNVSFSLHSSPLVMDSSIDFSYVEIKRNNGSMSQVRDYNAWNWIRFNNLSLGTWINDNLPTFDFLAAATNATLQAAKEYADAHSGGGAVASVNGHTGVVHLAAADVGAPRMDTGARYYSITVQDKDLAEEGAGEFKIRTNTGHIDDSVTWVVPNPWSHDDEPGDYDGTDHQGTAASRAWVSSRFTSTNDVESIVTNSTMVGYTSWVVTGKTDDSFEVVDDQPSFDAAYTRWQWKCRYLSGDDLRFRAFDGEDAVTLTFYDEGEPDHNFTAKREKLVENALGLVQKNTPTRQIIFSGDRGRTNYVMTVENGEVMLYMEMPDEN